MRDVRPILHRVPDFEPSTEPCGGRSPGRRRCAGPPADCTQSSGAPSPASGESPGAASMSGVLAPGPLPPGTPPASPGVSPVRAGLRSSGIAPGPDESRGAVSVASSATTGSRPASAGHRPRIDRKSLRANRSAPAGIRRAHRAAHTAGEAAGPDRAREFAGTALRILLEVLDRRRPVAQLDTLCAPALVHTVGALVAGDHAPSRTLGAAVLTKYRLFPADDQAFELIAMYHRGPRRLALAGRVERTAAGWKLTALRLT